MKLQQESFHEKISDMSIKSYLAPNLKEGPVETQPNLPPAWYTCAKITAAAPALRLSLSMIVQCKKFRFLQ